MEMWKNARRIKLIRRILNTKVRVWYSNNSAIKKRFIPWEIVDIVCIVLWIICV